MDASAAALKASGGETETGPSAGAGTENRDRAAVHGTGLLSRDPGCLVDGGALPAGLMRDLAEVAASYAGQGPQTGVFTDGGCEPNPGQGGWGVVNVQDGEVLWQDFGGDRRTTNNRMELQAIIRAFEVLPADFKGTICSDSNLCVRTLNEWAGKWEANGWVKGDRKPPENLDLVKSALQLARAHPDVCIKWLRGHSGATWNEYADRLAGAGISKS